MSNVNLPEIPDVPQNLDEDTVKFLQAVKETLAVLTGKLGGNTKLIDYMES
jgi:hypothetical protein